MKTGIICVSAGLVMTGCVAFPVDDRYSGGYGGGYYENYPSSRPYYDNDPRYQDGVRFKRARGAETTPAHRPQRLPPGHLYAPAKPVASQKPQHQTRPTPPKVQQQNRPYAAPSKVIQPMVGTPMLKNQFGQPAIRINTSNSTQKVDVKKSNEKKKSNQKRDRDY